MVLLNNSQGQRIGSVDVGATVGDIIQTFPEFHKVHGHKVYTPQPGESVRCVDDVTFWQLEDDLFCKSKHTLELGEDYVVGQLDDTLTLYTTEELQGTMQVSIKTLTGKTVTADCRPTDTIMSLKLKVQEALNITPSSVRLLFKGRSTQNNHTLLHHDINNGDQLNLVLQLRGGMLHGSSSRSNMRMFSPAWTVPVHVYSPGGDHELRQVEVEPFSCVRDLIRAL